MRKMRFNKNDKEIESEGLTNPLIQHLKTEKCDGQILV
jgi:hypothetical protein